MAKKAIAQNKSASKKATPKSIRSAASKTKSSPKKKIASRKSGEELSEVFSSLVNIMRPFERTLTLRSATPKRYELWSEKPMTFKGKMRTEWFFAGLVVQKGYVGFYFMPVYTDVEIKPSIGLKLLKTLKGKSCFHIKQVDELLLADVRDALVLGYDHYEKKGWI
jgi:hypothetical protein